MSNTKIKAGQFSGIVGNGTDGYFLMTNGDGTMAWEPAGAPSPTVTSVTYPGDDTAADPAGGQSVTLTGTNFVTGATVTIGGTTAPIVSFVSATELTIATPAKAAGDYDIVVTNTDGGTATFVDGISYNGIPSWTTASGSLGTFASDTTISTITLQASEPDAGTITFNITSGALPTGLSLTGADIDGTTSKETADTLYNFTVTAIDDENQSTPRAFSITVEKYIVPAPENFEIVTYTGNGGTQAITSKIGKAASFNGSSSYINSINLGTSLANGFSYSYWVNFSSLGGRDIYFNDGTDTEYFFIYVNSGVLNVVSNVFTSFNGSTSLSTNTWYHITLTASTSQGVKLYLNNSLEGTSSSSLTSLTTNIKLWIGADSSLNNYLNGSIDQVRIFDKAISSSEVTTLYNETYASSTKSTTDIFGDGSGVALYELDEDANDTGTTPYGTGAIDSGQSAVFNGSSSKISTSVIPLTNTSFTVSSWIYNDTLGTRMVFAQGNTGNNNQIISIGFGSSNQIELINRDNSAVGLATTIPSSTHGITSTGTWYHLAVVFTSTTYNVYVDGTSIATGSFTANTGTFNTQNIGVRQRIAYDGYFNGKIDQVRIYSSALSVSDVEALVSETNVPTANLVAHYKLDGNANDETGSYNGTPTSITYSDPAEFPLIAYNGTPTNVNFLGMAFQPDLVWIKSRSDADHHVLLDSVRGGTNPLVSSGTSAEIADTDYIQSFDSNGFTIRVDTQRFDFSHNESGDPLVAWCWKAGGVPTPNNNTQGTITSTVSANPDAGFSIVSYTGNGVSGATIGHGLSSAPEIFIVKRRDLARSWHVLGSVVGLDKYLLLDTADGLGSAAGFFSLPNNTTINYGTPSSSVNASGGTYIAYCFHSVDGYQKVGSYTGTGASANKITTGFKPRFLLVKQTNTTRNWYIIDSVRNPSDPRNLLLVPNSSDSEYAGPGDVYCDFLSDGFEWTSSAGDAVNQSGGTYIYLAIA